MQEEAPVRFRKASLFWSEAISSVEGTMRTIGSLILVSLFLASGSTAGAPAEPADAVRVVNLPDVQKVEGTVTVEGRLDVARSVAFEKVALPPAPPDNPGRMVDLGLLDAAGFRSVVVSLAGEFPLGPTEGQTVGVLLVPDEDYFVRALKERGRPTLSLRIEAPLTQAVRPDFTSGSLRFDLAFPRYRIFLFNTGKVTVEANVFFYLTH